MSLWLSLLRNHHRDTENTEVAQRRQFERLTRNYNSHTVSALAEQAGQCILTFPQKRSLRHLIFFASNRRVVRWIFTCTTCPLSLRTNVNFASASFTKNLVSDSGNISDFG